MPGDQYLQIPQRITGCRSGSSTVLIIIYSGIRVSFHRRMAMRAYCRRQIENCILHISAGSTFEIFRIWMLQKSGPIAQRDPVRGYGFILR